MGAQLLCTGLKGALRTAQDALFTMSLYKLLTVRTSLKAGEKSKMVPL